MKFRAAISMLTTSFPSYDKHFAGSFVYELGCHLVGNHGFELEVITPDTNFDSPSQSMFLPDGFSLLRFRYFWPRRFQKLAQINSGGMPQMLRTSLVAWLNVPTILFAFSIHLIRRANRVNLIHAHWGPLAAVALILKPFHRKPVILTVHGSDYRIKIPFVRWVTKFGIRHSNAVIVLSGEFFRACQVLRKQKGKVYFIPNGVKAPDEQEIREIRSKKIESPVRLVTVGRLVPERNHDVLIHAIGALIGQGYDVKLSIVGSGPYEKQLKSIAKSIRLENDIKFWGELPTDEVSKVLLQSHLYVSPTSVDNYGTAVVEASLHGLPIITTPIGFPGELVINNDTGFHVEPRSEQALIGAIEYFLKDRGAIMTFGSAMLSRAIELGLTWQECSRRTAEVYSQFL